MEEKKSFFKKAWTSIKDFDKYEEFAADKVSSAIKYIAILTIIFTVVVALSYTYKFYMVLDNVKDYINENISEMKLEDGILTISSEEELKIEDEDGIVQMLIIDTSEEANEEELLEKIGLYDTGVLVLKDKAIISSSLLTENEVISYEEFFETDLESKEEFVSLISGSNMAYSYFLFAMTVFVYLFIVYFISNLMDGLVLGVLGYLFARIVRLKLKYRATFNIGLHALTLPIVLNLIYLVVNTFTGFTITYFQWMYTTISYIYVAVAILMIKTEIINQKIQLVKLEQIQEKVSEEETVEEEDKEEKKEEPKEEKKSDDKKEEDNGEQPEGSNA